MQKLFPSKNLRFAIDDLRLTICDLGAGVSLAAGHFELHITNLKSQIVNRKSVPVTVMMPAGLPCPFAQQFSLHNCANALKLLSTGEPGPLLDYATLPVQ